MSRSPTSTNWTSGYHLFQMLWEPGQVTFYIDNVETASFTTNVPAEPMYLMLNFDVGGPSVGVVPPIVRRRRRPSSMWLMSGFTSSRDPACRSGGFPDCPGRWTCGGMIVRTWADGGRSPAQSPTGEPGVSDPGWQEVKVACCPTLSLDGPCRRPAAPRLTAPGRVLIGYGVFIGRETSKSEKSPGSPPEASCEIVLPCRWNSAAGPRRW